MLQPDQMFFMCKGTRSNDQIQKDFKSMLPHTTIEKNIPEKLYHYNKRSIKFKSSGKVVK